MNKILQISMLSLTFSLISCGVSKPVLQKEITWEEKSKGETSLSGQTEIQGADNKIITDTKFSAKADATKTNTNLALEQITRIFLTDTKKGPAVSGIVPNQQTKLDPMDRDDICASIKTSDFDSMRETIKDYKYKWTEIYKDMKCVMIVDGGTTTEGVYPLHWAAMNPDVYRFDAREIINDISKEPGGKQAVTCYLAHLIFENNTAISRLEYGMNSIREWLKTEKNPSRTKDLNDSLESSQILLERFQKHVSKYPVKNMETACKAYY